MLENDAIFKRIVEALLVDYSGVYYVDSATNEYQWYSIDRSFRSLQMEQTGGNFFADLERDARQVVYEEDQHIFLDEFRRETLLEETEAGKMRSVEYRLMIDGEPTWHSLRLIRGGEDFFVIGIRNIHEEVLKRQEAERFAQEREAFNQIAASLAEHYDTLYYVDVATDQYTEFSSTNLLEALEEPAQGVDFFRQAMLDTFKVVYPDDRDRMLPFLDKEDLLGSLNTVRARQIEYRLLAEGGAPSFVRLSAMFTRDRSHLLLCVENIDEQVRRENAQIRALRTANEKASQDEMTGAKNKNAYQDYELVMQEKIDNGTAGPFAIVVCDLNNLKKTNDTLGHKAGDESIRAASKLICDIFKHSPVFRIGGDEFVAVLRGSDYTVRNVLYERLLEQTLNNRARGSGPVIASGMAVFAPETDTRMAAVFERADSMMYQNKKILKE